MQKRAAFILIVDWLLQRKQEIGFFVLRILSFFFFSFFFLLLGRYIVSRLVISASGVMACSLLSRRSPLMSVFFSGGSGLIESAPRCGRRMYQRTADTDVATTSAFSRLREADPFFAILGPCSMESRDQTLRIATKLAELQLSLGDVPVVFKSSFDKANRTSFHSYRGVGLEAGVRLLEDVKAATGLLVTTDIHESSQAALIAPVVDVIQIPAFLCRQVRYVAASGIASRSSGRLIITQSFTRCGMAYACLR